MNSQPTTFRFEYGLASRILAMQRAFVYELRPTPGAGNRVERDARNACAAVTVHGRSALGSFNSKEG
jgi:hypothetical protein